MQTTQRTFLEAPSVSHLSLNTETMSDQLYVNDLQNNAQNNSASDSEVHPYADPFIDNLPHPEIRAMSVLSLYEKESERSCCEMDTNRYVRHMRHYLIINNVNS